MVLFTLATIFLPGNCALSSADWWRSGILESVWIWNCINVQVWIANGRRPRYFHSWMGSRRRWPIWEGEYYYNSIVWIAMLLNSAGCSMIYFCWSNSNFIISLSNSNKDQIKIIYLKYMISCHLKLPCCRQVSIHSWWSSFGLSPRVNILLNISFDLVL